MSTARKIFKKHQAQTFPYPSYLEIESCQGSYINDINGIIVKPNDEKALATAIYKLSKNSKRRISYGRLSRQIAIKKLDLKICAKLNFNVYKNINL